MVTRTRRPPAPPPTVEPAFTLHERFDRALAASRPLQRGEPPVRPLRIFTSDPTASRLQGRTAVAAVPYEPLVAGTAEGEHGRYGCLCGSLLELHLVDAQGQALPLPELDAPLQLMQQGHAPNESSPQFAAQMVYAVASMLHADFRRALGREPGWGFSGTESRLKVYPMGAEEENAWYDSNTGQLIFGSFSREGLGRVHTALMHDIVAHELTHALLDSQRPHFLDPLGPDVLGFHEGFADLMALFQHFRHEAPLKAALRASRGVLFARSPDEQSADWLCRIARQFGQADGHDALRRADRPADELFYHEGLEEHELGELLLSAVFDAFDTVFRRRTAALRRLATGGSGLLPAGELPPDLLDALTQEAMALARRFMAVTVRALDYCPPAHIELGEYLRAMVTADALLVPDDAWGFREAVIDAFRARRILPRHVASLSEESLLWGPPDAAQALSPLAALSFAHTRFDSGPGRPLSARARQVQARALGDWVSGDDAVMRLCGLLRPGDPALKPQGAEVSLPSVDALEVTCYASPSGDMHFHTVAVVTQTCQVRARRGAKGHPAFDFTAGATLLFDPDGRLVLVVRKGALGEGRIDRRREAARRADAAARRAGARRWLTQGNALRLDPGWLRQFHARARRGGPG